mgnify:FL=1
MSLAADIVTRALEAGVTITTAESCTGGLVAGALTDIAGSSGMFERGVITYSNAAKTALLGVSVATLDAKGAVSEEVAAQLAQGARATAGADIAISVTGIAGPGGSDFKPEGRVCFGLATPEGVTTQTVEFGALGRAKVRAAARDHALGLLAAALDPAEP